MTRSASFALALTITLLVAATSAAQTPPRGEGNVTTTYQRGHTFGQLNSQGQLIAPDGSAAHSVFLDIEYGITDRFAVHTSLPFMAVRFAGGPHPHTIGIHGQPSNLDDGNYHAAAQDFHVGGRWSLLRSQNLMLAPYVDGVIPSHQYESLGQAVVGRDVHALIIGTTIGGFPDGIAPGLYYEAQVSHAFVEKVLSVRANQSNVDGEVGYFITPRLAARFVEAFQYTHNGVDFIGTQPAVVLHGTTLGSRDIFLNHDRLLMTRVLNVGGGVTVGVSDRADVFFSAVKSVWGRNVQGDHSFTLGANWHFRTPASR